MAFRGAIGGSHSSGRQLGRIGGYSWWMAGQVSLRWQGGWLPQIG